MPQTQPTAFTQFMSNPFSENNTEIGSSFTEILDGIGLKNNSLTTGIKTNAGSKGSGSEMQGIRSETGGQESQDSPLVIDSDTDDIENEDDSFI
ncbi:hypothetical protein GP486_007441 [Trichoglossum hirsutum]|uniref:Uncharacterized protein n=1 Tax=Trichoglossum hirsutum TaxID=265104 RepID=A0A9P8IBR6_9PEZI|nr:hypothetical protein GP486_007441 [Trichoglossum hirsutum]